MNLKTFSKIVKNLYLMVNTQFLQQDAHFILQDYKERYFNITIYKNFIGLQRSIGQQKQAQL